MRGLSRIAREPLGQFLVIGAAVFALFALLDDAPPGPRPTEIIVTEEKVARLIAGFEAVWLRPPTEEEIEGLIEDHIREEVFVREALALGLDRDDVVVRRRLRQKMKFLTESAAEVLQPTDDELRAHYAAHQGRFRPSARIAFQQVFLGAPGAEVDVAAIQGALASGGDALGLGVRTLLPFQMPPSPLAAVDGTFGSGFFDAIAAFEVGVWSGPVASGYGLHLVRLLDRGEAAPPLFEATRDSVLRDWTRRKAEELAERQYERLRALYEISRPAAPAMEPERR